MSDSDISAKGVLVKYIDKHNGENSYHYMHNVGGDMQGVPSKKGAMLFSPPQATKTINYLKKRKFPFALGTEVVK